MLIKPANQIPQTPGFLSADSAVNVAASSTPLSLGTKTDGSVVQPACHSALYASKPTVGSTSSKGVMPVTPSFATVGGMAKTVKDLVDISGVLLGGIDFSNCLNGSWEKLN